MRVHTNPAQGSVQVGDEFFRPRFVDADRFGRADICALLSGTAAVVGVRRLLSPLLCAEAMARLDDGALAFGSYDRRRVDPPVARFGPAINDFREGDRPGAAYWAEAGRARRVRRAALGRVDPFGAAVAGLARAWGRPLGAACNQGRPFFAGTLREINHGALVHCDDVLREYGPHLFDGGPPVAQLAFNAWISTAPEGGATRVWRRRWRPGDSDLRKGYGFDERVVAGEQCIEVTMGRGDALLFDSRNFHAVEPSAGGRRLAVAFFLGFRCESDLVMWS
ncbi:2OG-Fe(II) oxygenase [Actinomadura terrae]|uniref:2OG-Fe(II) oxygenase n=1 Tax=Actinomadura terrae TaxID=604353 RepID=UPI001FA71BB9|nr:2OG-Fe(II) oxygenase [Actinomadura terrae]